MLLPALVFEPAISLIAKAICAHAATASDGDVPRVLVLVVNDGTGVADGTNVNGSHYCLVVATFRQQADEINMTNNGGSNTTSISVETAPDKDWKATSIRKKMSSSGVCNFACYRTHVLTLFA